MGIDTKVCRGHHPQMEEHHSGGMTKVRRVFRLRGMEVPVEFGIHNNSMANLRRGLLERVFFVENDQKELVPAPKPQVGAFETLSRFRKKLHYVVGTHSRISPEEFLGFYSGRRLTIYKAAVQSLMEREVERKDAHLTTFVKAEKINLTSKGDPAPRVIQPRNVRYNVEVGRYLRRFEHYVYRGIDTLWGGPTVIKGYTVEQIGSIISDHWNRYTNPCAIGFDMKRFDQHVSVEALQWEHQCYLDAFSHDPELERLLQWQLVNKGWARASNGSIKYTVEGCRMSGDMNTAMGNCLLSCAIVWQFAKENNIKCSLINNGDDCVVIADASCGELIQSSMEGHWKRYGFQCIVEPTVTEIEHIEFCQMRPVFTKDGYVMIRNPHVSLSKDCYSITPWNTPQAAMKWVKAVGDCGMCLTGGIPILQSFYGAFKRNSRMVVGRVDKDVAFSSGFASLAKMGNREECSISEETRYSFYRAFDIAPDVQTALESYYDNYEIVWQFEAPGKPTDTSTWINKNLTLA